ncbi:class I SAM-dependent methyltransferase [Poseidonibacter antarcticus]|uniref:class I SAM-dependent methyltransferase n=1 Tax=Poseidonibacter antarcticus TaxID=2478538 RepID=UPI0013CE9442|nr:class I SAM-dependent methyltransferase [Poseidonibacter antarcticus]
MEYSHTITYYENNSSSLITQYELANVDKVQNLLLKTFSTNSKLLEIGCGSGRDAGFMIQNNYNVIGIDGSKKMIEEAKMIHPELSQRLFHSILPNNLKFDKKFDGIYSIATLMHLSKNDLKQTIKNIYNILNLNGRFLMSVSLFRDDIGENGFDKKGRFFLVLKIDEWIEICESVGFRIIETKINKDGLNRDGIEWLTLIAKK